MMLCLRLHVDIAEDNGAQICLGISKACDKHMQGLWKVSCHIQISFSS